MQDRQLPEDINDYIEKHVVRREEPMTTLCEEETEDLAHHRLGIVVVILIVGCLWMWAS